MRHKELREGVLLLPETVAEAGMLQWIATRFCGSKVSVLHDTWTNPYNLLGGDGDKYPGLFLQPGKVEGPPPTPDGEPSRRGE